jgi:hypothetical protein
MKQIEASIPLAKKYFGMTLTSKNSATVKLSPFKNRPQNKKLDKSKKEIDVSKVGSEY